MTATATLYRLLCIVNIDVDPEARARKKAAKARAKAEQAERHIKIINEINDKKSTPRRSNTIGSSSNFSDTPSVPASSRPASSEPSRLTERRKQEEEDYEATLALILQLAEDEGGIEELAGTALVDSPGKSMKLKRDCMICMETIGAQKLLQLPCKKHWVCAENECLETAITGAIKSRSPFACCGKKIGTDYLLEHEVARLALSSAVISDYMLLEEELGTPPENRFYCGACSSFIYPSHIKEAGDLAVPCERCLKFTCTNCKAEVEEKHSLTKCKRDKDVAHKKLLEEADDEKMRKLAKKKGWMQCPKKGCGRWVEKTEGCNHITCKCGFNFCYKCRAKWDEDSICATRGCVNVASTRSE